MFLYVRANVLNYLYGWWGWLSRLVKTQVRNLSAASGAYGQWPSCQLHFLGRSLGRALLHQKCRYYCMPVQTGPVVFLITELVAVAQP